MNKSTGVSPLEQKWSSEELSGEEGSLQGRKVTNAPSNEELWQYIQQLQKQQENDEERIRELEEGLERSKRSKEKLKIRVAELENELLIPHRNELIYERATDLVEKDDFSGLQELCKTNTIDFTREKARLAFISADKPEVLLFMCKHCPDLPKEHGEELLKAVKWHRNTYDPSLESYLQPNK